jgi:UDP-N-acetylglucosamine transferase subunit ALG13
VHKIDQGLRGSDDSLWVTFDTPQSQSYLQDRRRLIVDYVAPRDLLGAVKAAARVAPYLRREKFDLCVSTGAAMAAVILPLAAWSGVPTYYVESVARSWAPSLTGHLMALAPRVRTLAQYEVWSGKHWPYAGSLLDGWTATGAALAPRPLNILVTLGTIRPYRFDRAVNAVLDLLQPGDQVTWQLGSTTRPELPGDVHREVSPARLTELARAADVVVAHAGVGSVLHLFENGISPVVAVRSRRFSEHVDEHQRGLADDTAARGLTSVLDLRSPARDTLLQAAGRTVTSGTAPSAGPTAKPAHGWLPPRTARSDS